MSSLLRIVRTRRGSLDSEPFAQVIWWTCLVDVNALLGGVDRGGGFVQGLINDDYIPGWPDIQRSRSALGVVIHSSVYDLERKAAWTLHKDLVLIEAKVGQLLDKVRSAPKANPDQHTATLRQHWRDQSMHYYDLLRRTWQQGHGSQLVKRLEEGGLHADIMHTLHSVRISNFFSGHELWSAEP
jgi:hypothetical protein